MPAWKLCNHPFEESLRDDEQPSGSLQSSAATEPWDTSTSLIQIRVHTSAIVGYLMTDPNLEQPHLMSFHSPCKGEAAEKAAP